MPEMTPGELALWVGNVVGSLDGLFKLILAYTVWRLSEQIRKDKTP